MFGLMVLVHIKFALFLDSKNCTIEAAPQPPPRRNQRENPFDRHHSIARPAPPPPNYSLNPNTQGNTNDRLFCFKHLIYFSF